MTLQQRIDSFVQLGHYLEAFLREEDLFFPKSAEYQEFGEVLQRAKAKNGWFTQRELRRAFTGVLAYLDPQKMAQWVANYKLPDKPNAQCIGVVMAGNIPMVGFHDLLCVLISGNSFLGKTSSQDEEILPYLMQVLGKLEPKWANKIHFTKERLSGIEAVIATGSDNTARYFEYYFKKYPHIIRKNRNSVAVLDHDASDEDIFNLGEDIFGFYGLGCRNISKVYLPADFDTDRLYKNLLDYQYVMDNKKYANNYLYHQTVFLMNKQNLLDNGFLLLHSSHEISSPVGMLFYERYSKKEEVRQELAARAHDIQAVISKTDIPFGRAQSPELWDYADGVDTLKFLANLAHH